MPHLRPSVAERTSFGASLRLLRTRRFGTFCFASLLSNLGTWAQQVAEPWLLLTLGASSFLIGLDSFATMVPVWVLSLIGGILADRADRRRIIAVCQSIQMLCPTLLVVLLLIGAVRPWIVIACSVVVGITDALSMPSFSSIVPSIVAHDEIGSALALNATQFNLSRILGPALAGVLMASLGVVGCFAANALSYLPFIWVALWILPHGSLSGAEADSRDSPRLFAGVREIAHAPHLRGALLTVLLTSTFCGPLIVFCPVLVKEALHGDVADFSLAIGAFGIGGLLGAVVLLGVEAGRDRRPLSSGFAASYGLVIILAALDPWSWGLPLLLVLAGLSMSMSNTSANTLLQATAPATLRGQAVSLYMLAVRGGLSIGSLLTGLSAHLLGVRQALLVNGLLAVAAQITIGYGWRRAPLPQSAS
ncbi:MAG TPA: MFS transporter [Stellaceae bacterium]|nr:MFS transporter [Stellaceae bacterium]